jgi:hypothetical protein
MRDAARILAGAGAVAMATPAYAATDAAAEVAAALYSASATRAALDKAADGKVRALNARIVAPLAQVKAGRARQQELTALQNDLIAQLAARDRAYGEAIAIFRRDVTDIASTPEGADALARFNNGDEVGALAVLDRIRAANDRMPDDACSR